jgi:hypothetical protein
MSKSQHELYSEVRSLKAKVGPLVIRRLAELSGIRFDEEGEPVYVPTEELVARIDERVVFAAVNSLRDQIFGKPADAGSVAEQESGERPRIDFSRFTPEQLAQIEATLLLLAGGPVIEPPDREGR